MKKLTIILFLILSTALSAQTAQNTCCTQTEYTLFQISEAINDLEDYIEWTQQDIEYGVLDEKIGLLYIENYRLTLNRLRIVYKTLLNSQK